MPLTIYRRTRLVSWIIVHVRLGHEYGFFARTLWSRKNALLTVQSRIVDG